MPTSSDPHHRHRGVPRGPLTATGVATLCTGVALVAIGGGVFGLAELTGLGIVLILTTVLAVASVTVKRPELRCTREPAVDRIFAGDDLTVQIALTHLGTGRSPAVRLHDPIRRPDGRTSTARPTVRSLAAGEEEEASYSLTVGERGMCTLGPMSLSFTDPFGLARRFIPGAGVARITILPRIEQITAPDLDADVDARSPARSTFTGSEFASLREYAPGDDLRKVHWRSSARRDELMVRQDEQPSRPGCTVLLDVRRSVHDHDTFERCVSVAASVLVAAAGAGQRIRLYTTDGFDSDRIGGTDRLASALTHLAITAVGTDESAIPRARGEVFLAVSTTTGIDDLVTSPGAVPLSVVVAPRGDHGGIGHLPGKVTIGSDDPVADAWNSMVQDRHLPPGSRFAIPLDVPVGPR